MANRPDIQKGSGEPFSKEVRIPGSTFRKLVFLAKARQAIEQDSLRDWSPHSVAVCILEDYFQGNYPELERVFLSFKEAEDKLLETIKEKVGKEKGLQPVK